MRVQELLDDIQILIPHSVPTRTIIRWLNEKQDELFRILPLKNSNTIFTIVDRDSQFGLPADCTPEQVDSVTINNCPAYRIEPKDDLCDVYNAFMIMNDNLFVHTKQRTPALGILYYKMRPRHYKECHLEDKIDYPPDHVSYMLYSLVEKVARTNQDFEMAAVYEQKAEGELQKMRKTLRKRVPTKVKNVRGMY